MTDNFENKEYFLATKDENDDFLVYSSDKYKFSEIDLLSLIKICLIEHRNKSIGNKLIEAYEDSTKHRIKITQQRLFKMGINRNGENTKPETARNPKSR